MAAQRPVSRSPLAPDSVLSDGLRSVLFWACLFSAASLYAAVVLSPPALTWLSLRREFADGQWRLVERERQVARLEQVIAAQRSDRGFIREQAHAAFDIPRPGEQRIPVEPHLTLRIGGAVSEGQALAARLPQYAGILRQIARPRRLSDGLIVAAAGLVLVAFSCFYERSDDRALQPVSGVESFND